MDLEDEDYEYEYRDDDDDDADTTMMTDADDSTAKPCNSGSIVVNPNAGPTGSLKSCIRLLPSEKLVPKMTKSTQEVVEILNVPPPAAAVLLRRFQWSQERLLEAFTSRGPALLKECGVYFRCNLKKSLTYSGDASLCAICCDSKEDPYRMPCGHEFCRLCWADYLAAAVSEGPVCVTTTCPQADCPEVVTEQEFQECCVTSKKVIAKFQSYQLRNFVESNALTRWCPGPGCEQVACAESRAASKDQDQVAHCGQCSTSFCLVCGLEPHAPCGCREVTLWNEKCRNESETANRILANKKKRPRHSSRIEKNQKPANWMSAKTKKCPGCSCLIEKNKGCNHMTCRVCQHGFCWICMGAHTGGFHKCNRYRGNSADAASGGSNDQSNEANSADGASDESNDQSDDARAQRELDRYLHYYKRFRAHSEAQTFAKRSLEETEDRMVLLQESSGDYKWSDVEFLKAANEQLVECRRVLKYTYVFAYYMDPSANIKKERFEQYQEMLERFTEVLSHLSEKPLAVMDRTDVVNQTRVVDRFMKNILNYVDDGMDES